MKTRAAEFMEEQGGNLEAEVYQIARFLANLDDAPQGISRELPRSIDPHDDPRAVLPFLHFEPHEIAALELAAQAGSGQLEPQRALGRGVDRRRGCGECDEEDQEGERASHVLSIVAGRASGASVARVIGPSLSIRQRTMPVRCGRGRNTRESRSCCARG